MNGSPIQPFNVIQQRSHIRNMLILNENSIFILCSMFLMYLHPKIYQQNKHNFKIALNQSHRLQINAIWCQRSANSKYYSQKKKKKLNLICMTFVNFYSSFASLNYRNNSNTQPSIQYKKKSFFFPVAFILRFSGAYGPIKIYNINWYTCMLNVNAFE